MSELSDILQKTNITINAVDCGIVTKDNLTCRKWHIELSLDKKKYYADYFMGMGFEKKARFGYVGTKPDLADVIYSLCSDSRAGEVDFYDFCAEFGYDTDSRKAEEIHRQCRKAALAFPRFLGHSLFDECALAEH